MADYLPTFQDVNETSIQESIMTLKPNESGLPLLFGDDTLEVIFIVL